MVLLPLQLHWRPRMFEALHTLQDNARIAGEQAVFVSQQADLLRASRAQMVEEAALPLHTQNIELLEELQNNGDMLDMPRMVEKLNAGLRPLTAVQNWQAYIEPISWVPHAPVALDENLSPVDGVRAIHGWHLQWHGPEDFMMPPMAVLLYQQQKEGMLEQRAAVTTMQVQSPDKKSVFDFRERLEQETLVLSAFRELYVSAHYPHDTLTDREQRLRFIADAKALRKARAESALGQKATAFLEGRQKERWDSRLTENIRPMSSEEVSGICEEMRLALLKDAFSPQGYEKLFPSNPSASNILQAFNLPGVNGLFAQPTTQKKWLGIQKITMEGGYIGERSWPLDMPIELNPTVTQDKIADKIGRLSWRRFFRHILGHPEE